MSEPTTAAMRAAAQLLDIGGANENYGVRAIAQVIDACTRLPILLGACEQAIAYSRDHLEATRGGTGSGTIACRLWNQLYAVVTDLEAATAPADPQGDRARPFKEVRTAIDARRGQAGVHPFVRRVYDLLYFDMEDGREFYNEHKDWDGADFLEAIADELAAYLPPPRSEDPIRPSQETQDKEVRTVIDTHRGPGGLQEIVTLPAAAGGSNLKLYEMTITRDRTESARVRVWATDVEHAQNLALSSEMEFLAEFEIDDLLDGNTYLPDGDDVQVVTG